MINQIKKNYKFFVRPLLHKAHLFYNSFGNKKKCYICKKKFFHFSKFRGGTKKKSGFIRRLNMVGSDVDNFRCLYCYANDRERHLFMFFDELNLWNEVKGAKVLHFAPEKNLSDKIKELKPSEYIKGDLFPANDSIKKIDATDIPFADGTFDLLICNHVLEHIPDYLQAMKEIYRVLKPKGFAILQTPYSKLLKRNFEEQNINTKEQRTFFYGQGNHVRVFSEEQFLNDLKETGFNMHIAKNSDYFDDKKCYYFGVNKKEDLIRVIK